MLIACDICKNDSDIFAWGFARGGFKKVVLDVPICEKCISAYLTEPRRILCEFSIKYEDKYKVLRIVGCHDNTPNGIESVARSFRLIEIILEKEHTIEAIKK